MGIFAKLFGSEKVIDAGISGLDKVVFTDEEKSDYFLKLLKAYEPFKIAQRLLALIVGIPYVIVWLAAAALIGFNEVENGKLLAEWNNSTLGTPFAIILAFYFGGGAVEGVIREATKK